MAKSYKLVTTLSDGTEINAGTFEVPDASGGTQLYLHVIYAKDDANAALFSITSTKSDAYTYNELLAMLNVAPATGVINNSPVVMVIHTGNTLNAVDVTTLNSFNINGKFTDYISAL